VLAVNAFFAPSVDMNCKDERRQAKLEIAARRAAENFPGKKPILSPRQKAATLSAASSDIKAVFASSMAILGCHGLNERNRFIMLDAEDIASFESNSNGAAKVGEVGFSCDLVRFAEVSYRSRVGIRLIATTVDALGKEGCVESSSGTPYAAFEGTFDEVFTAWLALRKELREICPARGLTLCDAEIYTC
jgi:hypothetical protein